MSDSLADRLKRLSQQHAQMQRGETDARNFQQKVNAFISDHSRPEYERLLAVIAKRVGEVNPEIGDLPKFQVTQGGATVEQGNTAAYLHFDKPIINAPDNALLISFGSQRNMIAMFLDERPPTPDRYRLQAAASDSLDRIVWVGDLGELTSEQLADFVLEHLTEYYLEHKRV
jgi:hypothetical protein